MIYETNTLCLLGTKRWDLLLSQIDIGIKKGADPTFFYHLFDRLPGGIRREMHRYMQQNGWHVDNPTIKLQPSKIYPLSQKEMDRAINESSKSSHNKPSGGHLDDSMRNDEPNKSKFDNQFGTNQDVFARFANAFPRDVNGHALSESIGDDVNGSISNDVNVMTTVSETGKTQQRSRTYKDHLNEAKLSLGV